MKKRKKLNLQPFILASVLWVGFGLAVLGLFGNSESRAFSSIITFLLIWMVSCLNMWVLSQLVRGILGLDSRRKQSPAFSLETLFWGFVKILCLFALGTLIWRSRLVPGMTILLGLSTLVVVPLLGGFIWSKKNA